MEHVYETPDSGEQTYEIPMDQLPPKTDARIKGDANTTQIKGITSRRSCRSVSRQTLMLVFGMVTLAVAVILLWRSMAEHEKIQELLNTQQKTMEQTNELTKEEYEKIQEILNTQQKTMEQTNELTKEVKACQSRCANGWTRYDASCYLLVADLMTWDKAADNCESKDSHLVAVETYREQMFLVTMYKTVENSEEAYRWFWIGARRDNGTSGEWRWYPSGTPVSDSDVAWGEGRGDRPNMDCGGMYEGVGYKFSDVPCHYPKESICESELYIKQN